MDQNNKNTRNATNAKPMAKPTKIGGIRFTVWSINPASKRRYRVCFAFVRLLRDTKTPLRLGKRQTFLFLDPRFGAR